MVEPGTAVPEWWYGGAADTTFELEVNTLAGRCLAAIPEAHGSWQLGDILGRLPVVLPGHRYHLLKGEAVLAPGTPIAGWAQPVGGRACVTAVVVAEPRTREEQQQLDKALIRAAGALDVQKVRDLLGEGADARYRYGFPADMTALRKAIDALGPRTPADRKEEKEGRLQAVMGALLIARADADARRREVGLGRTFSTCTLHVAVQYGSLGLVRMLLDARASVDAVSQEMHNPRGSVEMECESTALHMATQAGSLPLAALLLERGANINAVRRCLKWEDVERGEGHLAADTRRVEERETALHMAVAGGHQALVALFVQAGADASIARSRGGEETSLEELCAGNPEMLDALTEGTSAALLAGGAFGAEVEAALAAIAARRSAA